MGFCGASCGSLVDIISLKNVQNTVDAHKLEIFSTRLYSLLSYD